VRSASRPKPAAVDGATHLLSTRQVRDVLPTLLRGHDTEDDSLREGIQTVDEFEFGESSESDELRNQRNIQSAPQDSVRVKRRGKRLTWYISLSLEEIALNPAMNSK